MISSKQLSHDDDGSVLRGVSSCDPEVANFPLLFLLPLTYLRRFDPDSRPYISTRPLYRNLNRFDFRSCV